MSKVSTTKNASTINILYSSLMLLLLQGVVVGFAAANEGQPNRAPLLEYLPKLDRLRSTIAPESFQRIGSVDVIHNLSAISTEAGIDLGDEEGDEIGICHLIHVFEGSMLLPPDMLRMLIVGSFGSWEGAAAIALAAEHLNTGDGSIVPEVQDLNQRCNVRFTVESIDNENSQNDSVEKMIEVTNRDADRGQRVPCGIVGPYLSRNTIASALLLGIRGYPQLSPSASSPDLDIKAQYPFFGRLLPATEKLGELVILYLNKQLGVNHLGVLYHPDEYGKGFTLGLQLAAKKYAPDMAVTTVELVRREDDNDKVRKEDVGRSIGFLKDTQFTYFISLMNHDFHDEMMEEAYRQGIAGTGRHNWFFSENPGPSWVTDRTFAKGSPLHLAHVGTSRITATGGVPGLSPRFDKLEAALKEFKNQQDLEFLRSILPKYPGYNDSIFDEVFDSEPFLQTAVHPASFSYDAAITFGLAACNATRDDRSYFDGLSHYQSMVNTTFRGATGELVYDHETGSRLASSMTFEIMTHHLDPTRETEDEVGFQLVRSAIYQEGKWEQLQPLIFNDGTSKIPPDLPPIDLEQNLLTPGLRAGALLMCGLVMVISLSFATWTHICKTSRVVMASQPIFLHIICFGAFIMGSSIIPLSIDPGVASERGCDKACMAFPWLLTIGFSLMISALWAKTRRIHQIVQHGVTFKRVAVSVYDVSKPMMTILSVNLILLTVWTVVAPLYLKTEVVSVDVFGRSLETVSLCYWNDSVQFYATVAAVNFLLLCVSLFVAWQAREISTELSESEYIFKAMTVIILVCFICIPVIIIARGNPAAYFYVCSGIIFLTSTSILLLIFQPKVLAWYQAKNSHRRQRASKVPERFRRRNSSILYNGGSASNIGINSNGAKQSENSSQGSGSLDPFGHSGVMILKSKQELEEELKTIKEENLRLKQEIKKLLGGEEGGRLESAMHLPQVQEELPQVYDDDDDKDHDALKGVPEFDDTRREPSTKNDDQ